jgi:hypothetical protein
MPLASQKNSHWLWGHEKEVFDRPQPEPYNAWADELGGAYRIDGALWVSFSFLCSSRPLSWWVVICQAWQAR